MDCGGSLVTSSGFNLESDSSCALTGPGDLNNTNPQLAALGNNGGPTNTLALLSTSPAVGQGDPNGPATDQRGVTRSKTAPTIGAFEFFM